MNGPSERNKKTVPFQAEKASANNISNLFYLNRTKWSGSFASKMVDWLSSKWSNVAAFTVGLLVKREKSLLFDSIVGVKGTMSTLGRTPTRRNRTLHGGCDYVVLEWKHSSFGVLPSKSGTKVSSKSKNERPLHVNKCSGHSPWTIPILWNLSHWKIERATCLGSGSSGWVKRKGHHC